MAVLTFTGSTPGTFSVAANWTPAQVPTNADICIFTSSSPTCSLTSIGTCSQVDFTAYNKRINFGVNAIGVYGNITLGTQMSFSFSTTAAYNGYNFIMAATGSITTNGMTMGVPFGLYNPAGSNNTYTLNSNMVCAENFSTGAAAGALTHTINGFTISCYKNVSINIGSGASSTSTTGTTNILILGTNPTILLTNGTTNGFTNNITINAIGSVTMPVNFYYKTGTFKYISGTFSAFNIAQTGSYTLDLSGSSSANRLPITIDNNGLAAATITMLSDCHITGGLSSVSRNLVLNGGDIYLYGTAVLVPQGSAIYSGTTTIRLVGTHNLSMSGTLACNISIQTAGTINWNQVQWYAQSGGASFVYTSGTMVYSGANFQIGNSSNQHTFYTSGITFNNVSVYTGAPVNINLQQQLNATTLTVVSTNTYISMTGSFGFVVDTFSPAVYNTSRIGLSLQPGLTYKVNKNFVYNPAVFLTTIYGIKSQLAGSQSKFILAFGASQSLHSIVTDDIDSSDGQPIWIWNYNGITASTNTLNWNNLQPSSVQFSAINVS